jgi:hypothetical protein
VGQRVYRVVDHPDLQAVLRDAPAELLQLLSRQVYPLLRSDPTNVAGRWPVTWQPPWFILRIELADGVALLAYQVLEDELLVMTRWLLWGPTAPRM